jgi:hypothetical protein
MNAAKIIIDAKILLNENILGNDGYFLSLVEGDMLNSFENSKYNADASSVKNLTDVTTREYFEELSLFGDLYQTA